MPTPILLKASSVAAAVPAAAALVVRELALNTADGRLFTKTGAGVVVEFARKDQVAPGSATVVVALSGMTAVAGTTYVLIASLTLTLPASPSAGAQIYISNRSGTTTCVVACNGQVIMGVAEDMTLNTTDSVRLVFADAARGWVLL